MLSLCVLCNFLIFYFTGFIGDLNIDLSYKEFKLTALVSNLRRQRLQSLDQSGTVSCDPCAVVPVLHPVYALS